MALFAGGLARGADFAVALLQVDRDILVMLPAHGDDLFPAVAHQVRADGPDGAAADRYQSRDAR